MTNAYFIDKRLREDQEETEVKGVCRKGLLPPFALDRAQTVGRRRDVKGEIEGRRVLLYIYDRRLSVQLFFCPPVVRL
jgi:hypothetical protein